MVFHDRVLETTTTTGTGDITPAGAVAGFRTFSSVLSDADTFDYVIYAADANGAPAGAWEVGTGTWNSGVIERLPQASSNGGGLVDFAAGPKYIMLSANAATIRQASSPVPFAGARVTRTADQTVNNTTAMVAFTAEDYDYGGWHDNAVNNSRLTVPAGVEKIRVVAQIEFGGAGNRSARIVKNGAGTQVATAQVGNSAYSYTVVSLDAGVIECSPGDYFEVQVETSGNSHVRGAVGRSWFSIEVVSDRVTVDDISATVDVQAASAYTLQAADNNNIVEMSNGAANTLDIPANASVGIPVGAMFSVVQVGAGATTIQAAAGVTLNGVSEGSATLSGQWSGVSLYKRATDAWVIQGDHGGVA